MSKEEEKVALERKLQIAVDGHSAEIVIEALMLTLLRTTGFYRFLELVSARR